jgi:hypothetical protein
MSVGLTVMSGGAIALTRNAAPVSDPFVGLTDIFPGQPRTALEARGFSCFVSNYSYRSTPAEYCFLSRDEGVFSVVEALVSGVTIREVDFKVRENSLRIGDLMLLWGSPAIYEHTDSVNFLWEHGIGAVATPHGRHPSYMLAVKTIYITEPNVR